MADQLDPAKVTTLLTAQVIASRIKQMAEQIVKDYGDERVVLVSVLKGSFILAADLSRALWKLGYFWAENDFIGISSYGKDTESSRNPKITKDLDGNIENKHVLIVEDIVDTGWSLDALIRILKERKPKSLKTLVLLSKESRREVNPKLDYVGFNIDGWVEGFGLDTTEQFRGRPELVIRHD